MKSKEKDMTQGNIAQLILGFAFPLLIGNLFQQLYNTVDSFVVGNFVSKQALAAIGSTSMLINTMIGFFNGFSTGGSILVSQNFGAHNFKIVKKAVHTMVLFTLILGVIFSLIGILLNKAMLKAISTPDDVINEAADYLHIYFEGLIFLMLYNMGSAILRAVGDSKQPLYFLTISSLLNVALDLIFVLIFKKGIKGVAYATLISQAVSVVLVFTVLFKSKECYGLSFKLFTIDVKLLKKILSLGLPSGFQLSITFLSNTFVQAYINHFGADAMAGWAAYSKIDNFCLLPMQSVSLSVTTFVGQNYGAGKTKRAKQGVLVSLFLIMTISAIVMIPATIFSEPLVSIFNKDSGVVYYASYFLKVAGCFYIIRCLNQVFAGALRGFGNATLPMIVILSSFVLFRQAFLAISTRITENFLPIALAYPIGWLVCGISMTIAYAIYIRNFKSE